MIDKNIGTQCTGCTSCYNTCRKSAIHMAEDSEGFLYPQVDYDKCVHCRLCLKNCPIMNEARAEDYCDPVVYAAWNQDDEIRRLSTSGGVFTALAKQFIQDGGYIVGADYQDDFTIYHRTIHDVNEIERLRQSKYAQSDQGQVFSDIKKLLDNNERVLFCGCPCQVAGLQSFLGKSYEQLFCCEFICRGVISPKVYKKYLRDTAAGRKIIGVHFKNKDYGWNNFSTRIEMEDGAVYQKDRNHDPYLLGYLKHNLYMRPSCYNCKFKGIPRTADITLGDFWGIGNFKKELDTDMGTSLVLVNSSKGALLLQSAKEMLVLESRELKEVTAGNVCLFNSPEAGEFRDYFFENIDKYSFEKLIAIIDEKSLHLSAKDKLLRAIHLTKLRIVNSIRGKHE